MQLSKKSFILAKLGSSPSDVPELITYETATVWVLGIFSAMPNLLN